ncbi:hypothetical protein AB5J52_24515 [Streptomyces sp. R39]|uniref:CAP domain-containing protein n=1 Tax=Streptomyces sp. R39 TaxID=3238631 RepID=A0AB39QNM4_9ACTN
MSHPDHRTSTGATRRRERGLRRVGSTTRWVAAAAAAGSVVLATGYAHALPGKSSATTGNTSHPSAPAPDTPAGSRAPSHSAAPSKSAKRTTAPHRTASAGHPKARSTAPATPPAPAPAPQPSHTTSGAS